MDPCCCESGVNSCQTVGFSKPSKRWAKSGTAAQRCVVVETKGLLDCEVGDDETEECFEKTRLFAVNADAV